MNRTIDTKADDEREPVTVDGLLTAGIEYGTELSITFTSHGREYTIDVTAQGPPAVETYAAVGETRDEIDMRVAMLAVEKRTANYETYAVTVSEDGAALYDGDPAEEHTSVVGGNVTIDVGRSADNYVAGARLINCRDGLEDLREYPEIKNYAAEEYIDEAISSLEAAIVDVERGRDDVTEQNR